MSPLTSMEVFACIALKTNQKTWVWSSSSKRGWRELPLNCSNDNSRNQYGGRKDCFRHCWNDKFWSLNWNNFEQSVGRSKQLFSFVPRLQMSNRVSCSPQLFERLGYHSIILQIGRGVYEPEIIDRKGFSLKYYRYKDSIEGDIQRASLVISHAGMIDN